jgi:hypothetical protein
MGWYGGHYIAIIICFYGYVCTAVAFGRYGCLYIAIIMGWYGGIYTAIIIA